jgi:hypothetical protein
MKSRCVVLIALVLAACAEAALPAQRGDSPGPSPTGRAQAPFDLTGYWVSLVTEDWRVRQFTPPKGDYEPIPLNPTGRARADAWDPAKDEAAGDVCKAYGAPALMRLPTRLHIAWQDDLTLKLETDAGTQTRLMYFGPTPVDAGGGWQGVSAASWDAPRPPVPPSFFVAITGGNLANPAVSLKVVTTRLRPGYLRKNGVPYSASAVLTEYFDRFDVPGGDPLLVVVQEMVDPENLQTPFWTSSHFKRQLDATGWNPTPCSAR